MILVKRANPDRAAKGIRAVRVVKVARVDNSLVSAVSNQEKTIRDNLARVVSPVKVASRARVASPVRAVKAVRIGNSVSLRLRTRSRW